MPVRETVGGLPDIDGTCRALSRVGAVPSTSEEYSAAHHRARPHWVHYTWFMDPSTSTLYWSGNGDFGGDHSQFWKRVLTPSEIDDLPPAFLLRQAITIEDLQRMKPPPPHEDTPEEITERRAIVAAALEEAMTMPLSGLAASVLRRS